MMSFPYQSPTCQIHPTAAEKQGLFTVNQSLTKCTVAAPNTLCVFQ